MMHLAHINIGLMKGPITSKVMQPFRDQIARFNALAEESAGFIWRLQTASGDTADIDAFGNNRIFVTMSLWQNAEYLFEFTYRSEHANMFRRRHQWIERGTSQLALWWVPAGSLPSLEEGKQRLANVARFGATPFAFTLKNRFPAPHGILEQSPLVSSSATAGRKDSGSARDR